MTMLYHAVTKADVADVARLHRELVAVCKDSGICKHNAILALIATVRAIHKSTGQPWQQVIDMVTSAEQM